MPNNENNENNMYPMSTPLSAQHITQLGTPPPSLMLPMLPYYPHYSHFPPTAASNPADIFSHTPATPASKPRRKYQASARKKAPPISLLTGMAGETVESLDNDQVKLENVLRNIQAVGWTIGDFLYHFSKAGMQAATERKGEVGHMQPC